MYPILVSIGPLQIYSFSVFLVFGWLVFSFLFWRTLRADGVDEDNIFNLTFYATVVSVIVARLAFVIMHWELFRETWLKIVAVWVQPGLSWYGALVGGVATLVSMSRNTKVRLGLVLDALSRALPAALVVGLIGAFLDGTIVGKTTDIPWALRIVGHVGKRHPVALYEIAGLFIVMLFVRIVIRHANRDKRPYGYVGVWFFIIYSISMFLLELFSDARVYWVSLSANQWVLLAIFAEAVGALYVRGGGREVVRPFIHKLYAKFSKRRSE